MYKSSCQVVARRREPIDAQNEVTAKEAFALCVAAVRDVHDETRVADHRHVPTIRYVHSPPWWNEERVMVMQIERKLRHRRERPSEGSRRADAR